MLMSAMRCVKLAGLGALSALCVLNNNNNLNGRLSEVAGDVSAEVASARCAVEGGLKDESRTAIRNGAFPVPDLMRKQNQDTFS